MGRIFSLVLLFSLTFGLVINVIQYRFDKIIIFGDSLTDTGNAYKLTNYTSPLVPPYYQGRYSDGPNWVDKLTIVNKSNYAYAGATTDNNLVQGSVTSNAYPVPGVRQQIAIYINDTLNSTVYVNRTLHIIWAGGNDLIDNPDLGIPSIVNSLMNGVQDLLNMGAKNILIFNQPPAQAFPYFNQFNQTTLFAAITVQANTILQTSMDSIQKNYTNTSLQIFDINTLFVKILANQSFPFSNTVDACWKVLNLTSVAILCQDPTKYVFIDSFHLTSTVHQLIADAINPLLLYNECTKTNTSISILLMSLIILIFSYILDIY